MTVEERGPDEQEQQSMERVMPSGSSGVASMAAQPGERHPATPATPSRLWPTIDLSCEGKHYGALRLPFSSGRSAYGTIPLPITVIGNGKGPTALLVAGSHGDEYEGQIVLRRLARRIEPEHITGRLIILPHLNLPAVQAGRRLSPLDQGNLNRLFPGEPDGSPTAMIAHTVATLLLPTANIVIDLHAGGCSLDYLPCCLISKGSTKSETDRLIELMRIFGLPIGSISDGAGGGASSTLSATAQALGIPALTAELGGGATFSAVNAELATHAILRLLAHIGILTAPPHDLTPPPPQKVRVMKVEGREAFLYAPQPGLFETGLLPGDTVTAGQVAGWLHPLTTTAIPPLELRFPAPGLIACRRALALTNEGDCLFKTIIDV